VKFNAILWVLMIYENYAKNIQLHWSSNYALHSRQNSETFDVLHAFLSLVIAKLCDLKNSLFFWPTLYFFIDVPHWFLINMFLGVGFSRCLQALVH